MQILANISFDFNYIPLMIVIATAWLIPMLSSIFKITKVPTIILEIIGGYFIGRYLLVNFSGEGITALNFLALSGFMFLMFQSGLEINVYQITASLPKGKLKYSTFIKNPLLVGLAIFLITIILSYISTLFLSTIVFISNTWYFTLILITSSVGIIIPVLKNQGEINTRAGQMIVLAAAVADILSIILFSFTAFIIKNGFKIELLYILGLFIAFIFFYSIGLKLKKNTKLRRITYELSHAASQITVRGSILLMLIFIVLSQIIGEEMMLLGAFLSGLLLSFFLHKDRSSLILKLDGFSYGFFIPIFFIMVGANFNFKDLGQLDNTLYLFLALLLTTLFLVKIIPSFLWVRLFGFKKAISGGFLLSSRLSLIIAASEIGTDLGIISPAMNASFILMAIVTCIFSPIIYNSINTETKFINNKTVIIGGGKIGVILAKRLNMHNKKVVIIENNTDRYKEIQAKGINVIKGDGTDISVYKKINLRKQNHVIVLAGSNKKNTKVCETLKNKLLHEKVITLTNSSETFNTLKNLDVNILDVPGIVATTIDNLIERPYTYHTLVETFENFNVEEIKITNKQIVGKQIKEIPFHKDGFLILIKKGEEIDIPHGDTYLKLNNIVVVLGTNKAILDIREILT